MSSEQSESWSRAAARYEEQFVDPYAAGVRNPLPRLLERLGRPGRVAADLGCGTGVLLPLLSRHFGKVHGVDFAPGMLARARERCAGLGNVELHQRGLTDLAPLHGRVDVAVAVNSLVMPRLDDLERALGEAWAILRPGGFFLGIVPGIDGVQYLTMLLLDRARRTGMPEDKARQNAALHAEHKYYDFTFAEFHFQGLKQHFWQAFEIRYRLRRAGFHRIRLGKVWLLWSQLSAISRDLESLPPPWDWAFLARKPARGSDGR